MVSRTVAYAKIGLFLAACVLSFVACKKSESVVEKNASLELSIATLSVGIDGTEQSFEIITEADWTATSSAKWCRLAQTQGSGRYQMKVFISTNDSLDVRTAVIEVKTAKETKQIKVSQAVNTGGRYSDSMALHGLYSMIPFPAPNHSWDPAKPFTTWAGTSTSVIGGELRVVGFSLPDALEAWDGSVLLAGTILPASIGDLYYLRNLNLGVGGFFSPFPKEIGKLVNLESLKAEESHFQGQLPVEIGNLRKLKTLVLQNNLFEGDLPESLFQLTELETLNLSYNRFANMPDMFDRLPKLLNLNISRQFIATEETGMMITYPCERAFPLSVLKLTSLSQLNLDLCNMKGELPENMGAMSSLTSFTATMNKIEGKIPSSLFEIANLRKVNLSENQFSGSIPSNVGQATNLSALVLNNNKLTGSIPTSIGMCTSLNEFNVLSNQLSGTIPAELFGKMLVRVDISSNQFEGAVPKSLEECTNMISFAADFNKLTSFPPNIRNMKILAEFRMCGNQITAFPEGMDFPWHSCDFIDLRDNLIEGSIPDVFGEMVALRMLMLSGNKLSGDIPKNLLTHIHAATFNFEAYICPQREGYKFNYCPPPPFADPNVDLDENPGGLDGGMALVRRR